MYFASCVSLLTVGPRGDLWQSSRSFLSLMSSFFSGLDQFARSVQGPTAHLSGHPSDRRWELRSGPAARSGLDSASRSGRADTTPGGTIPARSLCGARMGPDVG